MERQSKNLGFTLVELMMAMMVTSIILAATATLAGATTAADQATDQMGRQQSQQRQISMQLTDMIRRANCVTAATDKGFILWHDNNADGLKTADELTGILRETNGDTLRIGAGRRHGQCKNIFFRYNRAAPRTQFITISYAVRENGKIQRRRVNARLRASARHRKF